MTGASAHRQRGWLLSQQGRADLAEQEYRLALADDPHDPAAHALLALLLAEQDGRGDDALQAARTAIGLAPDDSFPHYAEARVHLAAERWDAAERAAREATLIDPDDPDLFAALAASRLGRHAWEEALRAAEEGLAIDPAHVDCANIRGTALVHLGRREEASAALYGALAHGPDNSHTHANQGWAQLHRGDRAAALDHFREALRLDPESEWAREGLAEALKAGNPVYAGMLRYFLWMQRLPARTRWLVILGGVFGYNVAVRLADSTPALRPLLMPLMCLYVAFLLLSWTAPLLFNAVLMLSRDGRHVLSAEQRVSGQWVAAGYLLLAIFGAAVVLSDASWTGYAAILSGALLIPLAATFTGPRGRPRRPVALFAAAAYATAAVSIGALYAGSRELGGVLFTVCLFAVMASTWVINARGS